MYDTLFCINGITMSGRMGGLKAATLIDSHIYQNGSRFHQFEHLTSDQMRGLITRNQHRTYHNVHIRQFFLNVVLRREECGNISK